MLSDKDKIKLISDVPGHLFEVLFIISRQDDTKRDSSQDTGYIVSMASSINYQNIMMNN